MYPQVSWAQFLLPFFIQLHRPAAQTKMDKSVLMLVFLGCFPLVIFQAYALKCRRCDSYYYGICVGEYTTCEAKDDEVCQNHRITDPNNMSYISLGYADCVPQDRCNPFLDIYDGGAQLLFCCDDRNLCNDDTVPVDLYIEKLKAMNISLH